MDRQLSKQFVVLVLSVFIMSAVAFGQAQKDDTSPDTDTVEAPVELLDINSATRQQLMKLPGIDEAICLKIIAGRPYRSKSDLVEKKIVSSAAYSQITKLIVAKQPNSPARSR